MRCGTCSENVKETAVTLQKGLMFHLLESRMFYCSSRQYHLSYKITPTIQTGCCSTAGFHLSSSFSLFYSFRLSSCHLLLCTVCMVRRRQLATVNLNITVQQETQHLKLFLKFITEVDSNLVSLSFVSYHNVRPGPER